MERKGQLTAADFLAQPRAAVRARYEAAERGRGHVQRHPPGGGRSAAAACVAPPHAPLAAEG